MKNDLKILNLIEQLDNKRLERIQKHANAIVTIARIDANIEFSIKALDIEAAKIYLIRAKELGKHSLNFQNRIKEWEDQIEKINK